MQNIQFVFEIILLLGKIYIILLLLLKNFSNNTNNIKNKLTNIKNMKNNENVFNIAVINILQKKYIYFKNKYTKNINIYLHFLI